MTTPHDNPNSQNSLDAAFQSGADLDVPPEILNRARRHLDALRERMETRQMERNERQGLFGLRSHWGRVLAFATPVAALILAAIIFWSSAGNGGAAAYAQAVRRLRTAENMAFSIIIRMEGMPEQHMEMTCNNNGAMRTDMGKGIYSVMNLNQKKLLVVDTPNKQVTETNLANLPPDKLKAQTDMIEQLRRMPERANKTLGEKLLDGHLVNGFQVQENGSINEVWIDAATHDVVQIDGRVEKMPGLTTVMTKFRFNIPLAADFFSTALPAGFKKDVTTFDMKMDQASAEDIASLLDMWSAFSPDNTFPATLNPADLMKSVQAFEKLHQADKDKLSHPYFQKLKNTKKEDLRKATMENSQKTARAMVFIMQAKPENDWHYAGKGVKYGDAQTPIAWWKPKGAQTYKVIFGDLSVKDVSPEDIPSAPQYKKTLAQPTGTPQGDRPGLK